MRRSPRQVVVVVADTRHLPVEDGGDFRVVFGEQKIAHPVVAMQNHRLGAGRRVLAQPHCGETQQGNVLVGILFPDALPHVERQFLAMGAGLRWVEGRQACAGDIARVDAGQIIDELGAQLAAPLGRDVGAHAGGLAGGIAWLGNTRCKAVDHGRVRQVLAFVVDPEHRRYRHNAVERLDELVLAQATGLDDGFGRLHAQHHRRCFIADAGAVPGQRKSHLQLRGTTRQPARVGNFQGPEIIGANQRFRTLDQGLQRNR